MSAVIAAAGSGERLGAGGPKAFVPLVGRPMIEWSIAAFRQAAVAAVIVAVPREIAQAQPPPPFLSSAVSRAGAAGRGGGAPAAVLRVVEGGATRSASVSNALAQVETELVAVHDAARPLVSPELIAGVIATLAADPEADGAIAAVPLTDTIKRARGPSRGSGSPAAPNRPLAVAGTLDRDELWAAQTPQVFRIAALREALSADPATVSAATDEAMVVEAAGGRVLIHPAAAENLKVTTQADLELAERLLGEL